MIIPLFPINAVLFPGGRLPMRIFEARYLDMATQCMKDETPFGVCLIAEGAEVARKGEAAARPHLTGTLARVGEWDMAQLGILNIVAVGTRRFRLTRHWVEQSGLLRGEVRLLDGDSEQAPATHVVIPERYKRILPLLLAIITELADAGNAPAKPHHFDDADWVGMRFAEVLPIPGAARQTLLEVDDAIDRLEIIYRFLENKALLPQGD